MSSILEGITKAQRQFQRIKTELYITYIWQKARYQSTTGAIPKLNISVENLKQLQIELANLRNQLLKLGYTEEQL